MASIPTKKDKNASAPEARVCAHCLAPDGQHGVALKACIRCKAAFYCGRACQTAHWRAGHKQFCVTPEERAPQPASSTSSTRIRPPEEDLRPVECAVCLDPLASGAALCTLPCTHTFHASCVEGLRSFGIQQVCPMCRVELPPGVEKLGPRKAEMIEMKNPGQGLVRLLYRVPARGLFGYRSYLTAGSLEAAPTTALFNQQADVKLASNAQVNALKLSNAEIGSFAGLQILNLSGSGMILATGNSTLGAGVVLNTGATIPSFMVAAGATLDVNGTSFNTSTGWHKNLDGTLNFNAQQFSGGAGWTTIQGGRVVLNGGTNTLPMTTSMVINPGATLDLNGNAQTILTLTGTGTLEWPGSAGDVTNTAVTPATLALNQNQTGNLGFGGTLSGNLNFVKAGTGGLILNTANTFTGSFTVNGGSVFVKNYATLTGATSVDVNYGQLALENHGYYEVTDRLPDNVDVNLRGARFTLTNKANAATVERIGRLVLHEGTNYFWTAFQGGSGVNISSIDLISKELVRPAGSAAVVDFNNQNAVIGNAGRMQFQTPPTLVNGIIGGWAYSGRHFASYVNGVGVGQLTAAGFPIYTSNSAGLLTAVATDNANLENQNVVLAGNRTVNTLRLSETGTTARAVNLGGFTLNLAAGGLMVAQNGDGSHYTISNGRLTAGALNVGGDLYIHKLGYTASSTTGRCAPPSRATPASATSGEPFIRSRCGCQRNRGQTDRPRGRCASRAPAPTPRMRA